MILRIKDLGLVKYKNACEIQQQYVNKLLRGEPETLLLCEHPVMLTLGRLADETNMLISKEDALNEGIEIKRTNRGGDITLHCPGQLIAYPIFDLKRHGKDLHVYLRKLEQVAIDLLNGFDIVANRSNGRTGVWVKDKKIVSMGIGVRKWVSFHGIAINVNTDLKLFSMIRPCGMGVTMDSIAEIKGVHIDMKKTKASVVDCFCRAFQFDNFVM